MGHICPSEFFDFLLSEKNETLVFDRLQRLLPEKYIKIIIFQKLIIGSERVKGLILTETRKINRSGKQKSDSLETIEGEKKSPKMNLITCF